MANLRSPFGLSVDRTQQLVLATSELFRMAQKLRVRTEGLDEILNNRNSAQSKQKRFDRMHVRSATKITL